MPPRLWSPCFWAPLVGGRSDPPAPDLGHVSGPPHGWRQGWRKAVRRWWLIVSCSWLNTDGMQCEFAARLRVLDEDTNCRSTGEDWQFQLRKGWQMLQFNPYITFNGSAAAAMDFYAEVLGGVPELSLFRDNGVDTDGVMHAALTTSDGFHIFASDYVEGMGPEFIPGNDMQLSISGDEGDKMRGFWQALSDGGEVVVPLERQPWGDDYGQFIDRFGVTWHINISS